jgi:hypothetical protein
MAWIGGMLVAGAIAIFGMLFVVDHFIHPASLDDPLAQQGGLGSDQGIRKK